MEVGSRSAAEDYIVDGPQDTSPVGTQMAGATSSTLPLPRMRGGVGWGKWGLLLPGAPEPRLTLLRRQGFRSVFQTAYAA